MNISKQMKKVGIVAAIGAASALSSAGANAATMYFMGGDIVIDPSVDPDTFSLDLVVDDMIAASLGGGVKISFNSSIINITGVTFDPTWTCGTCLSTDNAAGDYTTVNSTGIYELTTISFAGTVNATRQGIATIDFKVVAADPLATADALGTSVFTFDSLGPSGDWSYTPPAGLLAENAVDEIYCMTTNSNFSSTTDKCLDVDNAPRNRELLLLQSSSVTVIPVPAAVWLFGSGLIGLVAVSRRKAV